ncbi:hypothetical protein [Salinimonas lutimaris]|uniref:hypothetical protein n=1 Tax=Salinimonas lutimaris TaxID=914153 RepID=UPI0010C0768D|nr:hypothetical protein [Salinimonas lutimaris]
MRTFTLTDKLTDSSLQQPLLDCLEDYCRMTGLLIDTLDASTSTMLLAKTSRLAETVDVRYLTEKRMLLKHQTGMRSIRVFEIDLLETRLLYTRLSG